MTGERLLLVALVMATVIFPVAGLIHVVFQ